MIGIRLKHQPMLANERLSIWKAFFVCGEEKIGIDVTSSAVERSYCLRSRLCSPLHMINCWWKFVQFASNHYPDKILYVVLNDNWISQSSLCSSFRNDMRLIFIMMMLFQTDQREREKCPKRYSLRSTTSLAPTDDNLLVKICAIFVSNFHTTQNENSEQCLSINIMGHIMHQGSGQFSRLSINVVGGVHFGNVQADQLSRTYDRF